MVITGLSSSRLYSILTSGCLFFYRFFVVLISYPLILFFLPAAIMADDFANDVKEEVADVSFSFILTS